MMWPLGSIQTFFVDDQTALGMPSLSVSSTCHCSVSVDGQRISTGPSSSSAEIIALAASDSVLPTPTSSASSRRALP